MLYYPIYSLRRLIYAISQIYLSDYPVVQKSSNLLFGFATFMYLIIVKPYKEKLSLITNIVIEGLLCLIFIQILVLHFYSNFSTEDSFNAIFIFLLMSCLVFQYIISFIIVTSKIIKLLKSIKNRKQLSKVNPLHAHTNQGLKDPHHNISSIISIIK